MTHPISGNTKILGLIADPIAQARSPNMANERLIETNLFGSFVVVPMHISAHCFAHYLSSLRNLQNFSGAIISMPHKIAAANLVDELTQEAALVGAVNVIKRTENGRLIGTTTTFNLTSPSTGPVLV